MSSVARGESPPIFSFVAGRHHGPHCWDLVRRGLDQAGIESIAHDLPIEDPSMDLNDHAAIVARGEEKLNGARIIRVGWSWGANVIPRNAEHSGIKRLIYIAGAFLPETIVSLIPHEPLRPKHSLGYLAMGQPANGELFRRTAAEVFYHDVENEQRIWRAVDDLKPHERRPSEPPLQSYPDLPGTYVVLEHDRVLSPYYQRDIASLLSVDTETIESGHAPMFSEKGAQRLTKLLIKIGRCSTN
jgi:hypothetical protein